MRQFTDEEKRILERFVTNIDGQVFVLRNLPPVVKGALFSRYSRSTKSLREVLLDEFIQKPESGFSEIVGDGTASNVEEAAAIKKAEEFYDRVLVGFGDDSIAELAGVHLALEGVSNIATKFIEDSRIGLSPLEKSTRYVYFDQKVGGKWLYYEEPTIMQSKLREQYIASCNHLFETYAALIPKISKYVEEKYPQTEGLSNRAYAAVIRAKTCDILRGILPAATLTNMGTFGNGRAFEYLLIKMYSSHLHEIKTLANLIEIELKKVIPSFVKRASSEHGKAQQEYFMNVDAGVENIAKDITTKASEEKDVELVDYDADAEIKIVAHALYPYLHISLKEAFELAKRMPQNKRELIIAASIGTRKNRRHRPGRAFENVYYAFDILANFGAYRDLHRHRILTQQRQLLSCRHGFTLPKEVVDAGYENEFEEAMGVAKDCYDALAQTMPHEAQYVVPLAYKLRWYIRLNLREAYHLCELRSQQQGHEDYRKVTQRIYREISRVHPSLAKHMAFVDMNEYQLGRLEAEKRIDKKLEELEKRKL